MREIKFRAWDKKNKKLYYFWYYEITPKGISFTTLTSPLTRISINHEDLILMQYTGLKDKNGKDIYEGDIVKLSVKSHPKFVSPPPWSGKVYWNKEECCWYFCNYDAKSIWDINIIVEVIGNIYENPELVK